MDSIIPKVHRNKTYQARMTWFLGENTRKTDTQTINLIISYLQILISNVSASLHPAISNKILFQRWVSLWVWGRRIKRTKFPLANRNLLWQFPYIHDQCMHTLSMVRLQSFYHFIPLIKYRIHWSPCWGIILINNHKSNAPSRCFSKLMILSIQLI